MVEAAKSGHPGLPLGAAPMAFTLWDRFLRHNPANPGWANRDRFILSAGHGSALLYSLLHLSGYNLPMEELKRFRQWESKTPGHPELGVTPGVELTTGHLGQGFAMGVGFAAAERFLAAKYNREGFPVVDHWTYGLISDGELMEGVCAEAASFAASAGIGKLIYLYDDNQVSLEGPTSLSFTESVVDRFQAYGWSTAEVEDGNDLNEIFEAITAAKSEPTYPWLIRVRTHIGYASPKQDTREAHGEPLGAEAANATKARLGWNHPEPFFVPDGVRERMGEAVPNGAAAEAEWQTLRAAYAEAEPGAATELEAVLEGRFPHGWTNTLPRFSPVDGPMASRDASARVLNVLASRFPTLMGGSADLAPSTKTIINGSSSSSQESPEGRNIHFGAREHAMASILNGLAIHGGIRPFGATFLIFSDYQRPAIRFAAIMQAKSLFLYTHDSIGVGEDGPTHQPVEQLWGLRSIPGMTVLRPADANETAAAWEIALQRQGPVAIVLTRQKLPTFDPEKVPTRSGALRGGYIASESGPDAPELVLLATGSEVAPCLDAARLLGEQGIPTRVVSMPSVELFEEQEAAYRQSVLPPGVPTLAVEAGSAVGWWRWVGTQGDVLGIARYGASAPGPVLFQKFGFSPENIAARAKALRERSEHGAEEPTESGTEPSES
ncbi:MAG: transketolase [Thermoplasmata archaeon]|nr:transketolase [Thermoplasmata archaeon]